MGDPEKAKLLITERCMETIASLSLSIQESSQQTPLGPAGRRPKQLPAATKKEMANFRQT